MTTTAKKSNIQRVLEIVLDDPGVSAHHIRERLEGDPECGDITGAQIKGSLNYLRRTDQIVNLGKATRGASWFPVD